jgi:integrase
MDIIGALRVFFRDFLDREVMDAFEMPSKSAKPTDVPSKEDLQTFYEALENPKYNSAFLFAATSGLHSSELCQLTMDDINEDKQMLVPDKEWKRPLSRRSSAPSPMSILPRHRRSSGDSSTDMDSSGE